MSMNTLRKMHALKKFKSLTADKSEAEVYGEIKKDKNKFSDEEAEELLRELYPQNYSEDNEGEGKENVQATKTVLMTKEQAKNLKKVKPLVPKK
jgi:hypothetical protein